MRLRLGSESSGGGGPIVGVFDAMFMEYAELWRAYPTFGRRGEERSVLSRLDWVYTNDSEVEAGHYV